MRPNKSIDGLVPRSAKSSQSNSVSPKTSRKSRSIPVKTPAKTSAPQASPIIEDSIEISVNDDEMFLDDVTSPDKSTNTTDNLTTAKPKHQATSKQPQPSSPSTTAEDFLSPLKPLDIEDTPTPKSAHSKNSTDSTPKDSVKKSQKKKPKKLRRIITTVALVIVIILIVGIGGLILWGNDIIAKITGGQGTVLDLLTFTEETYDPLKTDTNGRTNILAFGTSGYNMEGDEGNGTHDGAQLTDSIMMISLDQKTGDIAMLSLPRDLKASPTCTSTSKINEVYWCNGGGGNIPIETEAKAADALITEVGAILGVDFQYFAHLNWGSLIQIVDTLDGITITLDEDIHDYYWTGAVFDAGVPYTINGEQALGLARARHGTTGGDFSRGSSQQKILIGIKDKVFEKNLSIADIMSLASTLGDNLRTNFSLSEMKTLAHLTQAFDLNNTRQINLVDYDQNIYYMTTGMINGISYVLPSAGVGNYGAIQSYVAKNLSSDPRDYEEPTILILNATETMGLASAEQATLTESGYNDITIGDAPILPEDTTYPEGITLYALNSKSGSQKLLESHYGTTARPSNDLPSAAPHNYDFVIILNPSAAEIK